MFDFIHSLGNVYSLHFSVVRLTGHAYGKRELLPDYYDYEEQLKKLTEKYRQYQLWKNGTRESVELRFLQKMRNNSGCLPLFHQCYLINQMGCYVEPNGDIYPCPSLSKEPYFYLGIF